MKTFLIKLQKTAVKMGAIISTENYFDFEIQTKYGAYYFKIDLDGYIFSCFGQFLDEDKNNQFLIDYNTKNYKYNLHESKTNGKDNFLDQFIQHIKAVL